MRFSRREGARHIRTTLRRSVVVAGFAGVAAAVFGTGVAYAVFSGGTATGGGNAATPTTKTINASAASLAGSLYPNQTANLTVTIANPYSNRALTITGVAVGIGTLGVSGGSGCTAANSDVSVNTSASSFSPSTVAAGATAPVTITAAVKMGPNSNSGCQGATFAVPVAVTVKVG